MDAGALANSGYTVIIGYLDDSSSNENLAKIGNSISYLQ